MACSALGIDLNKLFPAGITPLELPSAYSQEIQDLSASFSARREYISHVGFPLLTQEFLIALVNDFVDRDFKTFIELEAGTGALTHILNNSGKLSGTAYSLEIQEGKRHWGLETSSPFYAAASISEELQFKDIRKLILDSKPDIAIASWIPYEGGEEVIEFFDNQSPQNRPDYFLVIGEGPGGCTSNDAFFDWLETNWDLVEHDYPYTKFDGIYDYPALYKSKTL